MRDDDEVPLEDMIAIEQVAEELWRKATKGSGMEWQALSVLAKQAWRSPSGAEKSVSRRPDLAKMIVASSDEGILTNHRRAIVVLFCDLWGFTHSPRSRSRKR